MQDALEKKAAALSRKSNRKRIAQIDRELRQACTKVSPRVAAGKEEVFPSSSSTDPVKQSAPPMSHPANGPFNWHRSMAPAPLLATSPVVEQPAIVVAPPVPQVVAQSCTNAPKLSPEVENLHKLLDTLIGDIEDIGGAHPPRPKSEVPDSHPSFELLKLAERVGQLSEKPRPSDLITDDPDILKLEDCDEDLKYYCQSITTFLPRDVSRAKEVQQRLLQWVGQNRKTWTEKKKCQQVLTVLTAAWRHNGGEKYFSQSISGSQALTAVYQSHDLAKSGILARSWSGQLADVWGYAPWSKRALPPK